MDRYISCLNAASFLKAADNPCMEKPKALNKRSRPVVPCDDIA
jgi:hypothetical protein